jgi:metal-responsive CopG/Arc/MetJ family transcriptional regulator
MKTNYLRTTVLLSEARMRQLDEHCAGQGTTRSGIIRDAISSYLDRPSGSDTNFTRIASLSEFTQAAVDILIREQAPDRRDEILATVEERMERYHAQG